MIVYTIGNSKTYDEDLIAKDKVKKVGKKDNYLGGWIWKTQEDAFKFIKSQDFLNLDWGDGNPRDPLNFSVYGVVICNWEEDIYFSNEDNQFHLLNDSPLVLI